MQTTIRCRPPARRFPRLVLVLAVLAAFGAGCRAAVDPGAIADAQLAARVKTVLVNDPVLGPRAVEVRVQGGIAHLSGRVLTDEELQRLVKLVEDVEGVVSVSSQVRVGPAPPAPPAEGRGPLSDAEIVEAPDDPRLLAVGGSISWTQPSENRLDAGRSFGPVIRLGSGRGLGLDAGLSWYSVQLFEGGAELDELARLRIRPVMLGLKYTAANERLSVGFSVVGGVAFNSLVPDDDEVVTGSLALRADNSLAARPGLTIWYDASRRFAWNFFAGYVFTRPDITYFEDGQLVKRRLRADAALVSTGLAFKLF